MATIIDRASAERTIADDLIKRGVLDSFALERARRLQQDDGDGLLRVLTKLGLVSERHAAEALAAHLGCSVLEAQDFPTEPVLEGRISTKFMRETLVLPIAERGDGVVLAMVDPLDSYAQRAVELLTGKPVVPCVATAADIEHAQDRLYGTGKSAVHQITEGLTQQNEEQAPEDVERLKDLASEAPVIRYVNLLITRAVEARASDIHIEPFESRLIVRYRVDGLLREVDAPPSHLRAAIISRVKIMAKLNIAERRLPQDGRIKLAIRGKDVDLRVSIVPTMHGEGVVMRILDRSAVSLDFASLGFTDDVRDAYVSILDQPHGILLVTGPTGSGKTTSLYTSLLRLNTPDKKLFTVEDPVEYQIEGVNQIQVKPQIGLTFAHVLRSILRQDPDIIMVGEIRDLETAEIAIQAALTGHMVLSTLHTNNAAATITRLLDMGLQDYLITSTLNGVIAQRLVRTLCPSCKEAYEPLPELLSELALPSGQPLFRARGCERCRGTGYVGRTGILELLTLGDSIRRLILQHAEANEIQRMAVSEGMRIMYQDGLLKVMAGITTLEELLRVTRSH